MVLKLEDKQYHRTNRFILRWKHWAMITIPLLLTPILIISHATIEARCAFCMLICILFWILDVLPLAVTALLPITLFPIFGVMSSVQTSPHYMKDINMLLFGGITAALGIEYCNLHRRIALKILLVLGTKPRWLFLGFMIPTVFLSMWINNTSATAMMVPIADSVLMEMFPDDHPETGAMPVSRSSNPAIANEARMMRRGIMLCISYGAGLGGTGTVTGTGPNLVFMSTIDTEYPDGEVAVNYLSWMVFCVPNMIMCVAVVWVILQIVFLGFRNTFRWGKVEDTEAEKKIKPIIRNKYDELGRMTYHEKTILILFIILVTLWVFRSPGFMVGWTELFYKNVKVKDSASSTLIIMLMFILPAYPDWFWMNLNDRSRDEPPPRALTWKVVHSRMAWGVLLIMGGGFAIAEGAKTSGLSKWFGNSVLILKGTSPILLAFLVQLAVFTMTSMISNTATATILLPILATIANAMKVSPLLLLLTATVTCSFAFLLPISMPAQAIVFDHADITMRKMAVTGTFCGIACILITLLMMVVYAPLVFDMSHKLT